MTNFCPECFSDPGLKKRIIEIRPKFTNEKCTFHPRYKGIPANALIPIIDQAFRQHHHIAEENLFFDDGDELEQLINDFTGSNTDQITEAVAKKLIESDYYRPQDGEDAFYSNEFSYKYYESFDYHHSRLWSRFCESITHEQRFFNVKAKSLIAEIFEDLHFQRDHEKNSPIYEIKPSETESSIFRARVAENEVMRKKILENPIEEIAAPPKRLRRPGRLNPAGIATFYGAFNKETCIAEIRPIVGSIVIVGEFKLTRPIYVLDITRFQSPIKQTSPFTKSHMKRVHQWQFMQRFMGEISKPISPTDEYIDYIPTQAVAEHLLHNASFKRHGVPIKIEGIVYKSAQYPSGKNIALMGGAAHIVLEEEPQQGLPQYLQDFEDLLPDDSLDGTGNLGKSALTLLVNSISQSRVHSASYETNDHLAVDDDF